jgi:hypothetical protein
MNGGDAAAREQVEKFILQLANERNLASNVDSFVWWEPEIPEAAPGAGTRTGTGTGETPVSLRIYRGNRWRQIAFAGPDLDACVRSPDVLRKYEGDIVEILSDI